MLEFAVAMEVSGEGEVAILVLKVSGKGKDTNFKITIFFGSFKISIFNFFIQI